MGYLPTLVASVRRYWLQIFIPCFIIYLCFFCSRVGATSARSNETDRFALIDFKAKITLDPFGITRLWNNSIHFCEWYGVTCSTRHQRVTELNLFSLKLGGSISPHVGNLSFLRVLQLQNNTFVHKIPSQIGLLRRLQVLNLMNNSLVGEIPINLSRCSELKGLLIMNNMFEGGIPLELGSLSKLQVFGASLNNLTGALPHFLGNLTSLVRLFVSENNLVGRIPKTLGSLSQLVVFALGGNHFFGEVPSSVFNITSLEILDVGYNLQLGGHLPLNLFNTLPNLQLLSFDYNQFIGNIPVSLSNASNLEDLSLSRNKLIGKMPFLGHLNQLSEFKVSENQLGGGPGAQDDLSFLCSLTNASALTKLAIDDNNFGGMFPRCITNLSSKLTVLFIDGNHISGSIPPGIDNLRSLESLSILNNLFTGTIPTTIGNLVHLVRLVLRLNHLSGPIPSSLGKLSKLSVLSLSSNSLEGAIPSSLRNCTFLSLLDLSQNNLTGFIPPQVLTIPSLSYALVISDNQLTGPLPEEIGKLSYLNTLDISANMLTGKIPDSLGECTSMQNMDLSNNHFQGSIPSSLSSMRGLEILYLDHNNLSGQIPSFLASFVYLQYLALSDNDLEGAVPMEGVFTNATGTTLEGNVKLCGGIPEFHLPECRRSTKRKRRGLVKKKKVVIATIAGLATLTLLIVLLSIFLFKRKLRKSREELVVAPSENRPFPFVTYGDLHGATGGFSEGNLVGAGSFGNVYRGILGEEGQAVAIKVLNLKRHGASKSFVAECEALRSIRHRNLVKLLTICSGIDYQGNEFKALIYEFMPNGSLEDWLHQPPIKEDKVVDEQDPSRKFGLLQRLGIAIDVASLLEYVHHDFGTPLVHCDIKPSNILLDDDLSGHVSDFGLAKFVFDSGIIRNSAQPSSSTGVRGTIGYAPPEYGLGSEVSTQGDVYSYGILLLEMFTGKSPTHEMFKEGLNLHLYAKMALLSSVVNILDPTLPDLLETEDRVLNPVRSKRVMDLLGSVIEIGVDCSNESPLERMEMDIVTTKLQKVRESLSQGRN